MMMGRTILASLLATGLFALPIHAQERDADNPLEPGLWEANLSASAAYQNFDSGGERYEIGGTASLGYFLTEWFELGGEISYIYSELDFPMNETQTTSLLAGPRILLNLPTGTPFVPYGIASGGVAWAETEVNDVDVFEEVGGYWQAGGGIRIFLNEFSALNIQVTYRQIHLNDVDMIDGVVGEAGFAVFF